MPEIVPGAKMWPVVRGKKEEEKRQSGTNIPTNV
jgi:hypothetical protein